MTERRLRAVPDLRGCDDAEAPAAADTTANDLRASLDLRALLRDVLTIAETRRDLGDLETAKRDHIREALKQRGRRSVTFPDCEASLRAAETVWCECHNADVRACPKAKVGERVRAYVVQLEPWLSVKETKR